MEVLGGCEQFDNPSQLNPLNVSLQPNFRKVIQRSRQIFIPASYNRQVPAFHEAVSYKQTPGTGLQKCMVLNSSDNILETAASSQETQSKQLHCEHCTLQKE